MNHVTYGNDDVWTFTTTDTVWWYKDLPTNNYVLRSGQSPKHFNCKRCGATNQVDVCEYCGSAYEPQERSDKE